MMRPFMQPSNKRIHLLVAVGRGHPVVVRAGVLFLRRADEGQVLDAGHVIRARTGAGSSSGVFLVQGRQGARRQHQFDQVLVFLFGTGAPVNGFGLRVRCDLVYPGLQ